MAGLHSEQEEPLMMVGDWVFGAVPKWTMQQQNPVKEKHIGVPLISLMI